MRCEKAEVGRLRASKGKVGLRHAIAMAICCEDEENKFN